MPKDFSKFTDAELKAELKLRKEESARLKAAEKERKQEEERKLKEKLELEARLQISQKFDAVLSNLAEIKNIAYENCIWPSSSDPPVEAIIAELRVLNLLPSVEPNEEEWYSSQKCW